MRSGVKRHGGVVGWVLSLAFVTGCTTASSPAAPSEVAPPTPTLTLTLTPDTNSPADESVGLTYASQFQVPGKIVVAVTAFNLTNRLSANVTGFSVVTGRLKWDGALLETELFTPETPDVGRGPGTLLGNGLDEVSCCRTEDEGPGFYPFRLGRRDGARVSGSGELFLIRLKPRPGVTSGTTRIELEPIVANPGGFTYMTPLWLSPYNPSRGNTIENTYGATITIR